MHRNERAHDFDVNVIVIVAHCSAVADDDRNEEKASVREQDGTERKKETNYAQTLACTLARRTTIASLPPSLSPRCTHSWRIPTDNVREKRNARRARCEREHKRIHVLTITFSARFYRPAPCLYVHGLLKLSLVRRRSRNQYTKQSREKRNNTSINKRDYVWCCS